MRQRSWSILLSVMLLAACASSPKKSSQLPEAPLEPPVAAVRPHSVTLHGDTRVDPYYWLRNKESQEVVDYLNAENAYARAFMQPTEPLQERLYEEIVARIQETDQSAPYPKGEYEYFHRTEKGKQYKTYSRREPGKPETEQVLLDLNVMAQGLPFLDLGAYEISPDGRYLAYSLDETGFRDYRLQVKDLRSGQLLDFAREKVKSVAWASDSKTLLYTVDDASKRPHRLYLHRIGSNGEDPLLYEESDERFHVVVWLSRSAEVLFRGSFSHTTSDVYFAEAGRPDGRWRPIAGRTQDHEYDVDHRGDHFLIRTNDQGRNFRLVSAPMANPSRDHWKELVSHRDAVMLESVDVFQDFYVLLERENGLPYLRVSFFAEDDARRIPMQEPVYSVYPGANEEFDARAYRYEYESLTRPESVFDYDVRTGQTSLVKQTEVLGGYQPSDYQAERVWATAQDGTKVPVSLVYRKGLLRDGPAPMLLVGYGAYGYPYPTGFSHSRVSLLDRGVTFAIAHIRGGGELGKPWHDQGRMEHKMNSFTDFIAVAEHLIAQGYTRSDRLAIEGGSAGGLLMGAVVNMRPELFSVVISLVPFVDVLNTMLDETLPLTVGEYEEWGNPNEPQAYARIKQYGPYCNIRAQDYPSMFVRTSLNDSQVMYWEPAKYVAKLRAYKTDSEPLLFHINMDAGHGGSSGRYDYLRETALDYAFLLTQLGLESPKTD
jgi:oligopeptidase B